MRYLLANGESLRIQEAVPEDADALLDMLKKVSRETNFLMISPEEADRVSLQEEAQLIDYFNRSPNNLLLVAKTKEKIVGSLSLKQKFSLKQKHIGKFEVMVLAPYWNMGIARRMMNHLMKWIDQNPVVRLVQLKVTANNEKAIRLFRNFGFKEEGRRRRAVYLNKDLYVDVIVMSQWFDKRR